MPLCQDHALFTARVERINQDGTQYESALDGLFPIRVDTQKYKCGSDTAQKQNANKRAKQASPAARNGGSADDYRGNGFQLQIDSPIRWH
jgi:hypothetical protein